MEMEFFVKPGTDEEWHQYWIDTRTAWYVDLGIDRENLRQFEHPKEKLSHYSKRTVDIEYRFHFQGSEWGELEGIANRTDFDLKTHSEHSGAGANAFDNCNGLTNVMIGNSVTNIGDAAFSYCGSRLTSLTIPDSVINIGNSAFAYSTGLTNVTIGNSVTNIGDAAFSYAGRLTSLTIPDSVINIGNAAFYNCKSLTNVTIGNRVARIGYYAFRACTSLTSVAIPASVTILGTIDGSPFSGCSGLTVISVAELNSSFSSVDGVLFNKSRLTLIHYPEGKAGSYLVPNSVASIGNYAFFSCTRLTKVTIPNSVVNIGDWAFAYCSGLTNITIGNKVSNLGNDVFFYCGSLTGAYFLGNAPGAGSDVFGGVYTTVYYLPGTTGWVRNLAVFRPSYGTLRCRPAMPALACGQINSGSPSPAPAAWSSWWKSARTWPVQCGCRCKPAPSPMARSISAIRSGRIIPLASTASARHELITNQTANGD